MINIITAFAAKNFSIGYDGGLPWGHLPEDMKRFKDVTKESILVMGRLTWESLPKKPLPGRTNVVVTSDPGKYGVVKDVVFMTYPELQGYLQCVTKPVFIIGGAKLYAAYMGVADKIYATVIENECEGDVFFPTGNFHKYEIAEYSDLKKHHILKYRFITYQKTNKYHGEFQYILNLDHILHGGLPPRTDRTKVGTYSLFGPQLTFDISKSFPLITTKFVGYKSILKELLFFLQGRTDTKVLEAQGVNIWKGNTSQSFLESRNLPYTEGDMGPMYGFNWRHFGAEYKGCEGDYKGKGHDQLMELIKGLIDDPFSRRHIITTFDPTGVDKSVLAPCHGLVTQFYVHHDNTLSCQVYCRSQDTFLGQPYNIASYAALTYIIAAKCGYKPNKLILCTGDCHVYQNHVDQAKALLYRKPLPFPILEVSDCVKEKSFDEITVDDFNLVGYLHHPALKAEMAV